MDHTDRQDRSPALAELLDDAYVSSSDVETAARHLWMIHKEADRLRREAVAAGPGQPAEVVPDTMESLAMRRAIPRAAVPLLVAVMLMSSSGMALAASQGSLPGDILYPVKRGTEHAQLVFARDPDTRAQLQLAFARTRLDEIRRIGSTRPQHVADLVSEISVSLAEVEESAPQSAPASQRIRQETTAQIASLSLPGTVTQAVDQAMTTTPAPTVASTATASSIATVDEARTATSTVTPMGSTPATDAALSPTSTPTEDPSAEPSADPTATTSEGATEGAATGSTATPPASGSSSGTASPSTSDDGSASPSPSPTSSDETPATPVVTPRPHPSGEGGTSRTEDESTDVQSADDQSTDDQSTDDQSADDQSTEGQGGQGAEDQTSQALGSSVLPFTRPQD